ncbi:hypothetical protein LTR56_018572 [Elasticomyces elasticus]|nr:hypothetical protein LTR56_018572 [Elasticomyces elasticus]KAK3660266.1 hypothetical protein LTR22_008091 [Elasticomyces elasticus]KAK4933663.1 hypothetical protein LTR49_000128 [Elasticomyces elasticus]KAK5761645.1 hypothetical protein LTS12_008249 [Elasticomyces elasticus]
MQGRTDSFRVTKTGGNAATRTTPPEQLPTPEGASTWIDFASLNSGESRKDVRAQAARASAAARRETLAKKAARRGPQPGSLIFALPTTVTTRPAQAVRKPRTRKALRKANDADRTYFHKLVDIVTQTLQRRPLAIEQAGETSLAHSSIRSMLWDAMTSSTTLFQVAIFMAGTHSNTCGLPRSAFAHMGPGLIALRGASLDAIQTRITGADAESIAPVAIALLAGWERRYGDPQSYEVHGKTLEDQNVATLTDVTLEMYRLGLDEKSTATPSGDKVPTALISSAPQGFDVLPRKRAETRSLLALAAQLAHCDLRAKNEVVRLRRLALENMAWSPTHSSGYEPRPDLEEQYDTLELNALYHMRAAHISICGIMIQHAMDVHKITWTFDLEGALHIHTQSCQHLRTEALLGTKYRDVGLWSRYVLCSLARDSVQDAFIKSMLKRLEITTFHELQAVLGRFVYHDAIFGDSCRKFWDMLTTSSAREAYSGLLQPYPTPDATPARQVP